MAEDAKTRMDLLFYSGAGIVVYSAQFTLYLMDYVDRGVTSVVDYSLLVFLFVMNMALILYCANFRNWARNAFLAKFVLLALFFYPQTWLQHEGSWIYSSHTVLSVFQRISNFSNFAYELFFALYLIKRSVRIHFVRR